jgi:hypothetical protein
MLAAQGLACFALEEYEEGRDLLRRAIEREPYAPANYVLLAGCLAELGDMAGAGAAIRSQRKVNDLFLQEYLEGKRSPFLDPKIAERYASALHRAADAANQQTA